MLASQSDDVTGLLERAARLSVSGFAAEAQRVLRAALQRVPDDPQVLVAVARLRLSEGAQDDARQLFARAAEQGHLGGLCGLIEIREQRGELHDALAMIDARPGAVEASLDIRMAGARILARLDRGAEACALLGAVDPDVLDDHDAARVHYALGDLHEAAGRYERAFRAWTLANARHDLAFDREGQAAEVDDAIADYDRGALARLPTGSDSERPVFIVGAPGSGAGLVERIVAAHPEVRAGGALPDINALHAATEATDPEQVRRSAESYLGRLSILCPDATRVTDTMPFNAMRLGFIAQLFPRARVIYCVRNPMDTAMSIWTRARSDYFAYAGNLGDIAVYLAELERMMNHWRVTLPLAMLDVPYEPLVTGGAPEVERIFGFLGLSADAAGAVPLSTEGIGRARPYASHLRVFRHTLASARARARAYRLAA